MGMPMASDDWGTRATADLFDAILTLDSPEEAAAFFRDLCTRQELTDLSHRWAVVRKLAAGLSYRQINKETRVSTATISRINQWLLHGAGGYRAMLARQSLGADGV